MAEAKKKTEDALWGEAGDMSMEFQKWEKVGDKVKGILVDIRKNSNIDKYGNKNMEYILMTDNGRVCVQGRSYTKGATKGVDFRVIYGVEDIPLGAIMGFVYEEDKVTELGTAKIIKPKYIGEKDDEALKKYRDMYATGDVEPTQQEPVLKDTGEDIELPDVPFGDN